MNSNYVGRGCLIAIIFLSGGALAQAQSTTWTNAGTGSWSVGGNWSPNTPPGPTTNVWITNSIGASSFNVTNDVANNTFADLTVFNPSGAGVRTLVTTNAGMHATGNLMLGRNGTLLITNWGSVSVDGTMLISNAASLVFGGGTLNVGGTTASAANASQVALTNLGTLTFSVGVSTLNASTNIAGIVNRGTITTPDANGVVFTNNAVVLNEIGGVLGQAPGRAPTSVYYSIPTNRGVINLTPVGTAAAFTIQNGDLVNEGTITNSGGAGFTISRGQLINKSNGTVVLIAQSATRGEFSFLSTLNEGTINLSNNMNNARTMSLGTFTNSGTLTAIRGYGGNTLGDVFTATNVINTGTLQFLGVYGSVITTSNVLFRLAAPITNQASGLILATNGAIFASVGPIRNQGTLRADANSVVGIGSSGGLTPPLGNLVVGTNSFVNEGTIQLNGGLFGSTLLTNASGATLVGSGGVGTVSLTTNLADNASIRVLAVHDIVNLGTVAPNGVLNVGSISNLSGGAIIGSGTIQSLNTTNFFGGSNASAEVNARIYNASGARLLASGGTLTLSNGFFKNTQAGTIGTTNGGTLRLGNGTLALTNAGAISLQGGAFQLGTLVSSGTIQGTGAIQAATVTSSGTLSPGFSPGTLSFSNDLTLTGSSTLNIEIAGTNTVEFDRLVGGGVFTRDGTLNVSLLLPYAPVGGETFKLFDFASLAGDFATTNFQVLGGGLSWDFSQFQTAGILGITSAIPEPGATALMFFSAAAFFVFRRKK